MYMNALMLKCHANNYTVYVVIFIYEKFEHFRKYNFVIGTRNVPCKMISTYL